jgi:uncharacterized protein YjbI with pentapeptide repeats
MGQWNSRRELDLLDRIVIALRERRLLEPGIVGPDDPVKLRGLRFPTAGLCAEVELPAVVVKRVIGRHEFCDAILRRVDLSSARLDFCIWNDCRFEEVSFDKASLDNGRFCGCHFNRCSFRSVALTNASFSVGRNGQETEVVDTVFDRADFRGGSCHNLVLRSTQFLNCRLDGFVFDGSLCEGVRINGRYKELQFRGLPGDTDRNRLRVDLSNASIFWLDVDYGVDLTSVTLPADGSCLVITDRRRAVDILAERLPREAGNAGGKVARLLTAIYSDRSISPMDPSQTTFLISRAMIADFAEAADEATVDSLLGKIRSIAREQGLLAPNSW